MCPPLGATAANPPETVKADVSGKPHAGLEAEYSVKFKDKVETETKRVEESMSTYYYSMAAFAASVFFFGAVALFRAKKQDAELAAMRAELAALCGSGAAK